MLTDDAITDGSADDATTLEALRAALREMDFLRARLVRAEESRDRYRTHLLLILGHLDEPDYVSTVVPDCQP